MAENYDVAIIGAGPAGMFAAATIKRFYPHLSVVVLERLERAGGKLPVTGGGRCNITRDGDPQELITHYGCDQSQHSAKSGSFLLTALYHCGHSGVAEFFAEQGLTLEEEGSDRFYPQTRRSQDVIDILVQYLESQQVDILLNTEITALRETSDAFQIISIDGRTINAQKVIIATGNPSFKSVKSNQDAFKLARESGLKISELSSALCSVDGFFLSSNLHKKMAGITMEAVIKLWHDDSLITELKSDILYTHRGFSGPGILDLSRRIRPRDGRHSLSIDFCIANDVDTFYRQLKDNQLTNKKLINALKNHYYTVPRQLWESICEYLDLGSVTVADFSRKQAQEIYKIVSGEYRCKVNTVPLKLAMQACGGVEIKQLDPQTMSCLKKPNLYIVGDQLELAGDCGGYNLTMAWSTAYLAGKAVGKS